MKKILPFIAIAFLTSCITLFHISQTSGLNKMELKKIPSGAKEVVVEKNLTPPELYEEIYSVLLSRGHRISKDDKERLYINTEWKAGAEAVMAASISNGVSITSEWAQSQWTSDRPGVAFAESVAIAKSIENGIITFK